MKSKTKKKIAADVPAPMVAFVPGIHPHDVSLERAVWDELFEVQEHLLGVRRKLDRILIDAIGELDGTFCTPRKRVIRRLKDEAIDLLAEVFCAEERISAVHRLVRGFKAPAKRYLAAPPGSK